MGAMFTVEELRTAVAKPGTLAEHAAELGCSPRTVAAHCKAHGLTRAKAEPSAALPLSEKFPIGFEATDLSRCRMAAEREDKTLTQWARDVWGAR